MPILQRDHCGCARLVLCLAATTAFLCLPPSAALAQLQLDARGSGFYALEQDGGLTEASRVPITVIQDSETPALHVFEAQGSTEYILPANPEIHNGIYAGAGAFAFASAEPGRLRAFARARAVAPFTFMHLANINVPNPMDVEAQVSTSASFMDRLTISSATLPIGTEVLIPVRYRTELLANDSLNSPLSSFDPMVASVSMTIGSYVENHNTNPGMGFNRWTLEGAGSNELGPFGRYAAGLPPTHPPYMFPVRVGDTINFGASLSIYGYNRVTEEEELNGDPAIKDNYIDARNTMLLGLDYVPEGLTITSDSGFDYTQVFSSSVAAAPEPATLALTGIGFLCAVSSIIRRRCRKP